MAKKIDAYYDKGQFVPIVATPSFYAYPIKVEAKVLRQCEMLRDLFDHLKVRHATAGFPRDAQILAEEFSVLLDEIMRSKKNVSTDTKRTDA